MAIYFVYMVYKCVVGRGLRQGDGFSCVLFKIALEGVIRSAGLDNDICGTILLGVSTISGLRV